MAAGRLAGRHAVVTGGASGIGLASARRFLAEGARVALLDRDEAALGRAAAELLFARIDGYDGATRNIVVPTRLIERGSGELRPSG
jgi:NAD(P)-dependent dehydrogenase (short-subunit alcohol dehydrogenase family)